MTVSHTDKTAPYWVKQMHGEPDHMRACGTGCTYCGMGKTRRRFETHRTRPAAKRALREGDWQTDY